MSTFARLAVVVGLALATPAMATTLARLSVDQMTDASDYIVRGTVTEVWTGSDSAGFIWTRARVDVSESLKGDAPDTLVVEAPGGSYQGMLQEVALAPRYSVDEDVLLFVARKGDTDRFGTVAMYGGKYTVRINPADGSEMVVHFTVPYNQTYDARFIPNPSVEKRVSVANLESQIRARVELGWDGQPIEGVSLDHLRSINKLQSGVK